MILFVELFYFAAKLKIACATPLLFWYLEWQCVYETQSAKHVWLLSVRRQDDVQWWNCMLQLTVFGEVGSTSQSVACLKLTAVWGFRDAQIFQGSTGNLKFLDAKLVTRRTFFFSYWVPASIRCHRSKFILQDNLTPRIFAAVWRLFLNTSSLRDTSTEILTRI
jgi:hypothetical protein